MKKVIVTLLLTAGALAAQTTNPVSTALKANLARAAKNMVAAAEEMPADKFSYAPTPESMTFGQLTLHVATSNQGLCHLLSGEPAPAKITLTKTSPKDELVAALKSAFEYCTTSLANMDDSKLSSDVAMGSRKMTQAALVLTASDDWADHYSQQAAYLRLNGLLPPTAKK
jgi:uncharacterized damage-inducible protein DinB